MSQHQTTDAAQTVLIIDDNHVNLRVLSDHLLQRGFRVIAAQDGEEGLELAKLVKPDLILLDIMMPGISGLEICRRLKASDATREIPVVLKTSLTDTATKIAGFEAGGVDYVTSPIQIEEVMTRVQTHLTLHTVKRRLEQQNVRLQREMAVREQAEKALEQARDELEERVHQRTGELVTEIAERKRTEEAMQRLNRELQAISSCNQILLHATDEQDLIDQICRIVCEGAGYRMAWVGYAEHDAAKSVRPVAWAGAEDGYLATANISWSDETERGRGPSGIAIRSGRTCYNQDFTAEPETSLRRQRASQRGYRSGIAFPLKDEEARTFGALTIYASEPNAFTAEEIRLLEELAHDLAFGIITQRTRAERKRAEQQVSLLRFALDNVREAAYLIDEKGLFHYINEEACRALGYTREELLGMGVLDINFDLSTEGWINHWTDLKSNRSLIFEGRHRAKDGHVFPVEVSANYFEYKGTAYNLALARDISERKRAEETLALRSFALNTVREGAFLIDDNARLHYVNEEACRVLGYTHEELLGMGVPDFDPDFPPQRWPGFWADLKSNRLVNFETRHRAKGGHVFPVEINANYFEYGGNAYSLAFARDLTERKRAEQEQAKLRQHLHQAQKMEAIGQLAGGVAHDFNNILGIIIGYSEIMLSGRKLNEERRSQIEEILAAGQRAASLTRQLLAFSRKLVLQPKVFSLNSVIEGFEKMLRRLIGEQIEVRTILDPNLGAVNADPNQMEQVLLNLCINARDAMPEGGRITIETANLELNDAMAAQHFSLTPGRYVTLSVTDTGIGMDKETQSHIFEPFFTTKDPERGTGLGLATVYGIVKQSGGHVSVYSEPRLGTTIRIYVPAVNQEMRADKQVSAPQELLQGTETLLLVEDGAPLRTLYHRILEDGGYTVLEAGDSQRAIQIAEQYAGNIALLLTDVSLPKMNGTVLAKILLQQRPTMKVLFMSGHSDDVVSGPDHLLHVGTNFIQKPFAAEELFRRLREILDPQKPEMAA